MSVITIARTVDGFTFVVDEVEGKRALTTGDAQHNYAFVESAFP